MEKSKRGKVWLAVSGLVISEDGKWLVVKKKYGGLKGKWSLPAGFVDEGETADEAVLREVREETGIDSKIVGLIGLRTGVIKEEISDNMIIFQLQVSGESEIRVQDRELYDVQFMKPEELLIEKDASILLHHLLEKTDIEKKPLLDGLNPGDQFGYTAYKIFL